MTQPDQEFPESAFNYESIAALATKTEEEWRAEMEGKATGGILDVGLPIFQVIGMVANLISGVVGGVVAGVGGIFDLIGALLGIGGNALPVYGQAANAQASADAANVGLTQLTAQVAAGDASGNVFNDTFARPNTGTLGTDYSVTLSGAAGGGITTDGNNAVVVPTGAGVKQALALVVGSTFSFQNDYQGAALVQDDAIPNIITPTEMYLILRANSALTHYLIATINLNGCKIHKVIGGTPTQLASATESNAKGDSWVFKAGTDVDVRELLLFHNNNSTPILRVTDTAGTLSSIGGSNLLGGFGAQSGQTFVPPFLTQVVNSTPVQSISLYDRLAAA